MSDLFLREFYVALDFEGAYKVIDYELCHEKAKAIHVTLRRDYDATGRAAAEYAVIAVRDRGRAASPVYSRSLVFVRKGNDLTPLPEVCGSLLTVLQPRGDHFAYYVFDAILECRDVRSTSEETTSPAVSVAESTHAGLAKSPGCPCVVSGTTVHQTDMAESDGEEEPLAWWECPDEPQSSVA